ncbi:MAG: hypothetical protein AAF806_10435 [Bacteroidota bacterium]
MSASPQEVNGFNAGYLIEKHLPKLSGMLRKNLEQSQNEFVVAFVAGGTEMKKERNRSKVFSKLRSSGKDIAVSKDQPTKGIEPEI